MLVLVVEVIGYAARVPKRGCLDNPQRSMHSQEEKEVLSARRGHMNMLLNGLSSKKNLTEVKPKYSFVRIVLFLT